MDGIAAEGLKSDNFRTRAAAVAALGQLGERFVESIIGTLADDYSQVRVAAIHALERLRPDGAWREHLVYECYVSAGLFIMDDDRSNQSDEKPAHEVYLDAFYIGKYPVTNADYKRYMDDTGQPWEIPVGKNDHPAVNVTWYQARDYARWDGMRLLTEAEWEKAASWNESGQKIVGTTMRARLRECKRKYPWGNKFDEGKCNVENRWDSRDTTPVGKYSPEDNSPYGCADMAGNVWEWTSSLKKPFPYRADDGREEPDNEGNRVLRGGAFDGYRGYACCTCRFYSLPPFTAWLDLGFRCGMGAFPISGTTEPLNGDEATESGSRRSVNGMESPKVACP